MTRKQRRRIVSGSALTGIILLLTVWRLLIYITERTAHFSGTPVASCGVSDTSGRYSEAINKARAQVQAMMSERNIPGLSIAVAIDGKIVWSEGFGFADLEKRISLCPQTQFRIASVSKTLTAAAVAELYEQGRLDLDAPVQRYVAGFPEKQFPITARELAGHLSGIRHYRDDDEALNTKHYNSVQESLEKFRNDPLLFPPKTRMHYSSYGYVLLSAAVEGASGEDFLSYMHRHVFDPLKMAHTTEDRVEQTMPDRTRFYDMSAGGQVEPAPYQDLSSKWGAGGFLSTAEDLVRFGSAHLTGNFLKPVTVKLLFTPQSRQFGILGYGMGWMSLRDLHLRRMVFHFGAMSGSTAFLTLYPDKKVCIAMLANLGHARFPFARTMGIVNPFLAATR